MSEETKDVHLLLTQLLKAIIDHPEDLRIETKEFQARVEWRVRVHIDDQGKVIGKMGAHIKALQFLFACIGYATNVQYRIQVLEPEEPRRGPENDPREAMTYDTGEAEALLFELLDDVFGNDEARITIAQSTKSLIPSFTFCIDPVTEGNRMKLETPMDWAGRGEPMTVVGAIGTLFRAYARKEGVGFMIEAAKP